ncbi:MAG: hypothetical protein ACRECW_15310 [Phyllobacterium sp.]
MASLTVLRLAMYLMQNCNELFGKGGGTRCGPLRSQPGIGA